MTDPADGFDRLLEVMARLRAPDGCPWDREQDHRSLKPYLIEEAYEVLEAIDSGEAADLREELGDLLLQVVFHCQLARENGLFDAFEVAGAMAEKLIRRHPHVFGRECAESSEDVLRNWEIAKRNGREGDRSGERRPSILDGVPSSMPSLQRAQRLQGKAARVGFDWPDAEGVMRKVEEEWAELKGAIARRDGGAAERELGDLLFSLVNLARKLGADAEEAARSSIGRFIARFHFIEDALRSRGLAPEQVSLEELEALWQQAKAREGGAAGA